MSDLLSETMLAYLSGRGISPETAQRFSLFSAKEFDGKRDTSPEAFWLGIPYFRDGKVAAVQYRDTRAETPKGDQWRWGSYRAGERPAWNIDVVYSDDQSGLPICITEGVLDALSAIEAGWHRAMAVPSAGDIKVLSDDDKAAMKSTGMQFVLAPDADAPGRKLSAALVEAIGITRCREFLFPEDCKDMNEILVRYGVDHVCDRLNEADFFAVDGYYTNKSRPKYAGLKPMKVRLLGPDFNKHVGICTKQISIWTGRPGNGKSTLLRHVAYALAVEKGWRTCMAFFEEREQLLGELQRLVVGGPPNENSIPYADEWLDQHVHYIEPPIGHTLTLSWFMDRAKLAARDGCKLIIADPWMRFMRDENDPAREMDHVRLARWLNDISVFAHEADVHFAIVAHPKRMELGNRIPDGGDILGGSVFDAVTDLGISVQRSELNDDWSTVSVWKSKDHRLMGPPGEFTLAFNSMTNRFSGVEAEDVASAKLAQSDVIDLDKQRSKRRAST